MLFVTWKPKEKDKARRRLAQPHWVQVAEEPEAPEITSFFKDFTTATPEQKAARWPGIKKEQKDFLASWKKSDREQARARGQAGSSSDNLRVPPPPPPPLKPTGTRPKAAPKLQDVKDEADTVQCGVVWPSKDQDHWTDNAGDSRRLNRPKDERVAGDRSGASCSSTVPRLLSNESAPAPSNDKTHDHK